MDDQCPVCKSDRYLNPKLRLLVSSCYHKMSANCLPYGTMFSNLSPTQVRILHRQIIYTRSSSLSDMQQGFKEISFHTADIRRSLS